MQNKIFTVLVGGKAGEGVKKAAQVIAHLAMEHNKHVFQEDDYQSLIKGGHNFSIVSISEQRLFSAYKHADLIISFDQRSVQKHSGDLLAGGLHFCDEADTDDDTFQKLPLAQLVKQFYPEHGNMSLASIAIFCAIVQIEETHMIRSISKEFKRNVEENIAFAREVYYRVQALEIKAAFTIGAQAKASGKLYTGNQLLALGAWAGGLNCYFSYPMTPASSILHYLAIKSEALGITVMHAESELAAANMAIGAAFAGKKAAVGSSGGGFALMQEAFSLAGMVEAPLLCFLSSRPGPATGVSTYTAQEDLYFALNQGHGEFPRIVASPDSYERAFSLAAELLQLAWESQSPAILLTEKHLSESATDVLLPIDEISPPAAAEAPNTPYNRYELTLSGISPLKYPGSDNCGDEDVIKWNSNEHMPSGVRTDQEEPIMQMKEKRLRKQEAINRLSKKFTRVHHYGSGNHLVFAYGSTALELREAQKYHDFELVVPIYLDPFPEEELQQYAGKQAIVVEHATSPSFARLLKEKLHLNVVKNILRYDGRTFAPRDLAKAIAEVHNA